MSKKLPLKKKQIKKATREELDAFHGVEPLGKALCDECSKLAYTRWYYSARTKREKVSYTLCFDHNEAMLAENKKRREGFGLQ